MLAKHALACDVRAAENRVCECASVRGKKLSQLTGISFCFPDFYEAVGLEKKWKYVLVIILLIPQLSPFAKLLGKYYGGIFL